MFAKQARTEGYLYLANIFEDNAAQEQKHSKLFFKRLEGRPLEITAAYPAGKVGTTLDNVKASIAGETEENETLYPEFARIAKEEGFLDIATLFTKIAEIEGHHSARFTQIKKMLENESVYEMGPNTLWICMKCGYLHKGPKAFKQCPVCAEVNSFIPYNFDFYGFNQ